MCHYIALSRGSVSAKNSKQQAARGPSPFGRRILECRTVRGWSQEEFSQRSGISTGMVSQLETGMRGWRPGRDLVLTVAKAFSEPEDVWLDLTRFAREHDAIDYRPTFAEYVEAEPYLTAEQKQALITTYKSMMTARRREQRRKPSQPE